METRMFLALFCIVAVLLITVNDGAPTNSDVVPTKPKFPPIPPPPPRVDNPHGRPSNFAGGRLPWSTKMHPYDKKLFNDYKKIISKKLQTIHKVSPKFDPKPAKVTSQVVTGSLNHYLIKLPINKYAFVTIVVPPGKRNKDANYGSEARVIVKPELFALDDKNI